jgi:hypothetical protein
MKTFLIIEIIILAILAIVVPLIGIMAYRVKKDIEKLLKS